VHGVRGLAVVALVVVLGGCVGSSGTTPTGSRAAPDGGAPSGAPTAGIVAAAVGAPGAPGAPAGGAAAPEPASAAPPALVPLRIGLNTPTASIAPSWVAKDEGFFAKYGLDVELLPVAGGERIVSTLLAGELPLSVLAGTALVTANLSGADLAFYGQFGNRLRYWLYARPEIATVQDLKGKLLATSGRGGINRRGLELALERNGVDPERDVTLVAMGQSNEALVALLNGAVAATVLSPPAIFRAEDEGMRMLVDTNEYNYLTVLSGIASTRAWVGQNEDLMRRAIQAIAEGVAFSHREKERTKEIIGRWTQVTDPQMLERTYTTSVGGWERNMRVPAEAVRNELDGLVSELPAARDARPELFYDNHVIDDLERSGFFQRLGS
jgi:NitT/TauT family transport system substrate-binding protein